MLKAMTYKELRETLGIVLLALVAFLAITTRQMGYVHLPWGRGSGTGIPFIDPDFLEFFLWVAAFFAIALGLRQTLGEAVHGTYSFLWHRPASRRWLLGMKLAVGVLTYLICAAIPILIYALWAATPGTHPSPFQWSMTSEVWQMWLWMTLLYFAAFLSGIRPGRWFGTRLIPLAAACAGIFIFINAEIFGFWGILTILFADALFLAAIFLVARQRDF
jgi:hypothetical protein